MIEWRDVSENSVIIKMLAERRNKYRVAIRRREVEEFRKGIREQLIKQDKEWQETVGADSHQ